jgi:hypothetical protein
MFTGRNGNRVTEFESLKLCNFETLQPFNFLRYGIFPFAFVLTLQTAVFDVM